MPYLFVHMQLISSKCSQALTYVMTLGQSFAQSGHSQGLLILQLHKDERSHFLMKQLNYGILMSYPEIT